MHDSRIEESTWALNGGYAKEEKSHEEVARGIWLYRGHTQEGHPHEDQVPHHIARVLSALG
jgi:hypothetical protein